MQASIKPGPSIFRRSICYGSLSLHYGVFRGPAVRSIPARLDRS